MVDIFLRALQKQKIHLERKISREKELTLHFPALAAQVIAIIHEHGKVGIGEIEKMTGANRNTLKKCLSDLTSQGMILRLGKGKATWYSLA